MKKTTLFRGLLAAVIMFSPLAAAAQAENCEHAGKRHGKLLADLQLTADQKTKLKELRKQGVEARKQSFERMKKIREQIKAELLKQQPSKQALDAFAAQLGDIHKELSMERHGHLLKVKEILTPEQFSKLLNFEKRGSGKHHPAHKDCREHHKDGDKGGCEHPMDGEGDDGL